ncbi:MAG: hypothetical protein PHW53_02270 [Patescibacteria group bacterium]|nr:hypothetical protein [Patescibacteria group bacterium]
MFDISPLLKISYWFDRRPPALEPAAQQVFFYVFAGLVALSVVISIIIKKKKEEDPWVAKGFQKVSSWCLTMGVAGLMIFFFSFEQVPILSMRIWFAGWAVWAVIWMIFIIMFFVKTIPAEKSRIKEKERLEKYLPGKK